MQSRRGGGGGLNPHPPQRVQSGRAAAARGGVAAGRGGVASWQAWGGTVEAGAGGGAGGDGVQGPGGFAQHCSVGPTLPQMLR
jgi:hypothetical protein